MVLHSLGDRVPDVVLKALNDGSAVVSPRSVSSPPAPQLRVKPVMSEPTFTCLGGPKPSQLVAAMSWAPFPKIPNVRQFVVKTGGIDELFNCFGIKKRVAANFEFSYYENAAALRYAAFTITRLRETKSDSLY